MSARQTGGAPALLLQPFYPALDGLRAIAFLMVFCLHYCGDTLRRVSGVDLLWSGVDIFFVLSGFLITGILIDTTGRNDFFRNFYVRRSLRIFPLYYGLWVALLLAWPFVEIRFNLYNLSTAAYLSNYFVTGFRASLHADPGMILYRVRVAGSALHELNTGALWSLCVEEQFYLVWPALIWFVRSRTTLLRICLAWLVLLPILRSVCVAASPNMMGTLSGVYYNSLTHSDGLIAGAAIALWIRGGVVASSGLRKLAGIAIFFVLSVTAIFLHAHKGLVNLWEVRGFDVMAFTCTAILGVGLLVLAIDPGSLLSRVLKQPGLARLGRISYGLYFFHLLYLEPFRTLSHKLTVQHLGFVVPIAAFALTWLLATLSARFLEGPFIKLKDRLAPRPGVADAAPLPFTAQEVASR